MLRQLLHRPHKQSETSVSLAKANWSADQFQRIVIQVPMSDRAKPYEPILPYQPGSIESITNSFCGG